MSNSQGVGKYEGDLKDGKRHGKGTLTFKDGGKYVGDWKNGKFHGKGTLTFPEGVKYFGEFGFPEGGEYVGQFKDGKMDGKGTLTFKDDSEYLEWHGGGKKDSYPTDNVQETETFGDGGKYVGQWKNGEFHGKGTLTFPDGRKYVGKFDGGFEEGDGTLSFPNGNKYVGQFHRGVEHGQGTLTFTSGNKFVGEFVYGEKWNGKMYIHNGNIHIIENGAGVETITKNQPQRSEKTSIKETSISTNEKIPPLKPTKKDKDRIFRIGCISVILIFFGYFLFDKILITTSTQEITELISKKKETWISSSLLSIFNYEWIDQLIKYQEKYGYVDSTIVRSNIALLSNFGRYAKNLCNKNITISVKIKEWGKEIKKDVYPSYYDQEKDCKRRLRNEINKFILNGLIDERGMIEIFQETNEHSMEVYFESYKNSKDLTTKRIFEKEYKKIKSEQQIFNQISIEVQLLITQYRNLVY